MAENFCEKAPPKLAEEANWLMFMAGCKGGYLEQPSRLLPPERDTPGETSNLIRKLAWQAGEFLHANPAFWDRSEFRPPEKRKGLALRKILDLIQIGRVSRLNRVRYLTAVRFEEIVDCIGLRSVGKYRKFRDLNKNLF